MCPKGWKLQESLTKRVKDLYKRYHKKYMDSADDENDAIQKELNEAKQKSAYSIYQNLKSVTYQNNIIESCKIKFYVEMINNVKNVYKFLGKAFYEDSLVAESEFSAMITSK